MSIKGLILSRFYGKFSDLYKLLNLLCKNTVEFNSANISRC